MVPVGVEAQNACFEQRNLMRECIVGSTAEVFGFIFSSILEFYYYHILLSFVLHDRLIVGLVRARDADTTLIFHWLCFVRIRGERLREI